MRRVIDAAKTVIHKNFQSHDEAVNGPSGQLRELLEAGRLREGVTLRRASKHLGR